MRAVLIEEPDGRRARIELRGESGEPLVFTVEAETDDRARDDAMEQGPGLPSTSARKPRPATAKPWR